MKLPEIVFDDAPLGATEKGWHQIEAALRCSKEFRGPRMGRQKAGENTQQRRLSRPVRTLDDKRLTACDFKRNILENQVFAALGAQSLGDEPHGASLSLYDLGRNAKKLSRFALWRSGTFLRNYL